MQLISNAILLGTFLTVTVAWADSDRQAVQDAVNTLQSTIQARQAQIANGQEPTANDLQAMKAEVQNIRAQIATVQTAVCPATSNCGGIPVADANRTAVQSTVQDVQTTIQNRQAQVAAQKDPTPADAQSANTEVQQVRAQLQTVIATLAVPGNTPPAEVQVAADPNRAITQEAVNDLQATIQARQAQIAASPEPTALQLQQMKDEVEAARNEFR